MGIINDVKDNFKKDNFSVAPNKKLKTLSADFKKSFGLSLVFYKGAKIADPELTLHQLKQLVSKTEIKTKADSIVLKASMKVGEVEELIKKNYGITVQIKDADGIKLLPDEITIGQAERKEHEMEKVNTNNIFSDTFSKLKDTSISAAGKLKAKINETFTKKEEDTEMSTNAIVCHTKVLKELRLHDLTNDWSMCFFDDEFNTISGKKLLEIKTQLEKTIRNTTFLSDTGSLESFANDFELDIDGDHLTIAEVDLPDGVSYNEEVETVLNICLNTAKTNKLNACAVIKLFGISYGMSMAAIVCGAYVMGESSCFEFAAHDDVDEEAEEDGVMYYDDDDNTYSLYDVVEILNDIFEDECGEEARKQIEDEDKSELMYEKFYNIVGRTVFSSYDSAQVWSH